MQTKDRREILLLQQLVVHLECCRCLEWDHVVYLPSLKDCHRIVCSFSIDNLQVKLLKKEYQSDEPWFCILLLHKILNGIMDSMNNNFRINNILPKLITSKHHW